MNAIENWWNDCGQDVVMGIVIVIVGIVLVFGVVIGTTALLDKPACYSATQEIGFPSRWGFWEGCQIEVEPGRWIPVDSWVYNEPAQ